MNYLKESLVCEKYEESTTYDDIKSKLSKLKKDDILRCLWGVNAETNEVVHVLSVIKVSDKKYSFLPVHEFMTAHDMLNDACKELHINVLFAKMMGNAVRLDYEDMMRVLDILPKFFDKYTSKVIKFMSYEKNECEKQLK